MLTPLIPKLTRPIAHRHNGRRGPFIVIKTKKRRFEIRDFHGN